MGKDDGPEALMASKKSEAELLSLENEIEKLKQRMRLLQSEERAEIEERQQKIKENDKLIKQLKSDIEMLQIQLHRGRFGDEKILKKAFQKHPNEMKVMRGRTTADALEIMEGRVFDMTKKRDALRYEVQKKETALAELKRELNDMTRRCSLDEAEHQETFDRAREVENELQAAQMRILEMQQILRVYNEIYNKLYTDIMTLPSKLEALEKEVEEQQVEINQLIEREEKASESRERAKEELSKVEAAAQQARLEKERLMSEFTMVVERREAHIVDPDFNKRRASAFIPIKSNAEEELNYMKQEQEKQLEQYRNVFEQIKIATGVSDINEAEKRFDSQKNIKENLMVLKVATEKLLQDMKRDQLRLESQRETILGANLATPKVLFEEELQKSNQIHEEQMQRKKAAELEYERVAETIANAKSSMWNILQMMEYHLHGEEQTSETSMPDISIAELAERVEGLLQRIVNLLKDHNVEELKRHVKGEQPFLKKMEDMREKKQRKVQKQPGDDESSSEDEEVKRRAELKREAQSFAEIKQKQKGRGRGLKL